MTRRLYCTHTHILVRDGRRLRFVYLFGRRCAAAAAALFSPFCVMHLTRLLVSLANYPTIDVCL